MHTSIQDIFVGKTTDMEVIVISKQDLDSFKDEIIQELSKYYGRADIGAENTWLRTRDVCRILNLSTSTIQNLRNKNLIPFTKLEGSILYKSADIESFLESK
jgi:hypothetical protein